MTKDEAMELAIKVFVKNDCNSYNNHDVCFHCVTEVALIASNSTEALDLFQSHEEWEDRENDY